MWGAESGWALGKAEPSKGAVPTWRAPARTRGEHDGQLTSD